MESIEARSPRGARRTVLLTVWGLLLTGVLAAGALRSAGDESTGSAAKIERGRYLVAIGGCSDCHTPWKMGPKGPEPDTTMMFAGHPEGVVMPPPPALPPGPWLWLGGATNTAFAGPWGVSYSFNLTPDQNTGIGIWTEDMFVKAMRTGRHMGQSRQILPPMPWPAIAQMTDQDLQAVFAFLKSLPPIKNRVPDAVVAEPPPAPAR
jgi:mono/diheme cytochrome c family protein